MSDPPQAVTGPGGLQLIESAVVGADPRRSDGQVRHELLTVVLEPLVGVCLLETVEDSPMQVNDRLAHHHR